MTADRGRGLARDLEGLLRASSSQSSRPLRPQHHSATQARRSSDAGHCTQSRQNHGDYITGRFARKGFCPQGAVSPTGEGQEGIDKAAERGVVRMGSSTAQGPGVRKPASLFIQTQKARARAGAGLLQTLLTMDL